MDVEDSIRIFRLRSSHVISGLIHACKARSNGKSQSSCHPPNLALSNDQLSVPTDETWITSGTSDPITLQPFIAAPSPRVVSTDHVTSNAPSEKLENSHWKIPALIACCFP